MSGWQSCLAKCLFGEVSTCYGHEVAHGDLRRLMLDMQQRMPLTKSKMTTQFGMEKGMGKFKVIMPCCRKTGK